ncbi:MAG: hypothetical protein HY574_14405 [candidate division NC10 bacterium]|nr:hypothetical protein [candidate division NC10 bacterium]
MSRGYAWSRRAGIEALDLTGRLNRDERKARLQAFRKGHIPVLTSMSILTEGYDDPPLDCLILARPTKSPLLIEQRIGRITRISPGKTDSLILDVVDVSRRHKLQTVASLFGLPSRLNLKGRSATETAEQVERALSRHPALQPELFATVEQLLAEAERMSLTIREVELVPHLSPEVLREADLAWIRLPSMEYALPLAGRVQIRVRENLLEQWEVVVLPDQTVLSAHPTRHEAFAVAEKEITERDPERARFARHEAAWRQHPVSKEQRRALMAAGLPVPATKGEASQLIDQLRERRQSRLNRPATPRQQWRLKQEGMWRDGMTLGEAAAVIQDMRQRETLQATAHVSTETEQGVK